MIPAAAWEGRLKAILDCDSLIEREEHRLAAGLQKKVGEARTSLRALETVRAQCLKILDHRLPPELMTELMEEIDPASVTTPENADYWLVISVEAVRVRERYPHHFRIWDQDTSSKDMLTVSPDPDEHS